MRLRILFFYFLIVTIAANAQTDFRPGYIIKTAGDTIYGDIDYRGDLLMSTLCKFKGANDEVKDYLPKDIIGFRFIDNKYFISKRINNTKVFLEYLVKGKLNIYYMRSDTGYHYFLDKENVELTEIPYKEGIKEVDNQEVYFETKIHFGILHYHMKDAPNFKNKINKIKKPEHKNLIKLAQEYHKAVCKDEECIVYKKKIPKMFIFEPHIGFGYYHGEFSENTTGKINVKQRGVNIYFRVPRNNEKIYLKTGLILQLFNGDEGAFKIPLMVQYIYRGSKLQPSIGIGLNAYIGGVLGTLPCANLGLNYQLSKKISLTTALDVDHTIISHLGLGTNNKSKYGSNLFTIGLRFDL